MLLTTPELLIIAIILFLFFLIFATRLKIEIIALIILLTLVFSGQVSVTDAFSGFSSNVVITLIGLFVITHTLEVTGVIQWIANRLNQVGQGSETKLIILFMAAGATLSLIMNNIAAGAVLLPAAVEVARISNVSVSKLLLPMSFGTLVGGMTTYLTTANILMSELLITRDFAGLGMLDFIPVGLLITGASLLYMTLFGRHMLPARQSLVASFNRPDADIKETYHLAQRLWRIKVTSESPMVNKTIANSAINRDLGLTVAAIWREHETISIPKPDQPIYADDELLIVGQQGSIEDLVQQTNATLISDNAYPSHDLPLEPLEIMIAPRSDAIGKSLAQMKLNSQYGLLALALWRDGRSIHTDVRRIPLQLGDAILVVGQANDIQNLTHNPNYVLPAGRYSQLAFQPQKAPIAILITFVVLAVAMLNILPLPVAMLGGAVAMVVSGCLTMEQFYEAISWRVIFLVAGMLPLSLAITQSGLADSIGLLFGTALVGTSPLIHIAGMVLLTMVVVQIIGGQVTALLVGPIAINIAIQIGLDPRAMAVAVAMACSMAFLTPIAHPVNILMMGPGGYKFNDFLKVGLGMTVVVLLVMLLGLVLFWGVSPI